MLIKLPKKIGYKRGKDFDPKLEDKFEKLLYYNEIDDYEAVRPLCGAASRLFEYGLHQAKATDYTFKCKLKLYESLLTKELSEGDKDGAKVVNSYSIDYWVAWGNDVPYWVRVAVEPWICEYIELIDKHMNSLGRPGFGAF